MMDRGAGAEITLGLSRRAVAPRQARTAIMRFLGDGPSIAFVRDAVLLTSEIVTNAITHGGGECTMTATLWTDPYHLRVAISDGSVELPVMPGGDERQLRVGGLGLVLVEKVAERWGVDELSAGGKSVWFEVAS